MDCRFCHDITPLQSVYIGDELRPSVECATESKDPHDGPFPPCEARPEAQFPLLLVCEKRAGLGMPLCPDALKPALDIRQVTLDGRHPPSRVLDGLRHAVVDGVVDLDDLALDLGRLLGECNHGVKQGDEHVFVGLGFVATHGALLMVRRCGWS